VTFARWSSRFTQGRPGLDFFTFSVFNGAMRRGLTIVAMFVAQLVVADGAQACRVRGPRLMPPSSEFQAVALATVSGPSERGANIRIDEILYGSLERGDHELWWLTNGVGYVTGCSPPRPAVETGQQVVVAFLRAQNLDQVYGWVKLEDAARADEFFARYPVATRRERRRLLSRWQLVTRYNGPVPLTAAENWMRPHIGGLGWTGSDGWTMVRFDVDDTGRISDCDVVEISRSDPRAATICPAIRDRRFARPMFNRERSGFFRVRWNAAGQASDQ
jgi:hypothetical protein